jgi:hypothetical protein
MVSSSSKKTTKRNPKTKARPTPTPHFISYSKKQAVLRGMQHRASASVKSSASTSKASRSASVEDAEDNEPTYLGGTLDMDGDIIMEQTDEESSGDKQGDGMGDPIHLFDEEDTLVDDDEAELSTS